jgi:hypothetical protein
MPRALIGCHFRDGQGFIPAETLQYGVHTRRRPERMHLRRGSIMEKRKGHGLPPAHCVAQALSCIPCRPPAKEEGI